MKNHVTKIGLLLFFSLNDISASQVQTAPSDQIPAGQTIQEVTAELKGRISRKTATPAYLKACLEFGVDPNTTVFKKGETLLMHTARQVKLPLVQVLLDHGADVNLMSEECGETVLHHLAQPWVTRPLPEENVDDIIAILDLLAEKGINFNQRTGEGDTIAHFPFLFCSERVLSHLKAKGVDFTLKDARGLLPLHRAVSYDDSFDSENIVSEVATKNFIQAGMDVNARTGHTGFGKTTLMLAATSFDKSGGVHPSRLKNVEQLIFAGADPLVQDWKGKDAKSYFKQWTRHQKSEKVAAVGKLLSNYSKLYATYGKDEALEKLKAAAEAPANNAAARDTKDLRCSIS